MTTLHACPVCNSATFLPVQSCVDYTVSKETFAIQKCQVCGFHFTNPRPEEDDLPKYYESKDYISHAGKGTTFLNKIYLLARTQTLRWKYDLVTARVHTGLAKTLLDIGCGTGDFLNTLQSNNWHVAGQEPSPSARQLASKKLSRPIHEHLSELGSQSFSAITLWHVLEHIPDLNDKVRQLSTLLEKDGTLFIAVPNHKSHDAQTYRQYWAGYDLPRHLWHFDRNTMQRLLTSHNLHITEIVPMKLDSFYVSLLSESYQHPGQSIRNMARGFFNGLSSNLKAARTGEYSSLIYVIKK